MEAKIREGCRACAYSKGPTKGTQGIVISQIEATGRKDKKGEKKEKFVEGWRYG